MSNETERHPAAPIIEGIDHGALDVATSYIRDAQMLHAALSAILRQLPGMGVHITHEQLGEALIDARTTGRVCVYKRDDGIRVALLPYEFPNGKPQAADADLSEALRGALGEAD